MLWTPGTASRGPLSMRILSPVRARPAQFHRGFPRIPPQKAPAYRRYGTKQSHRLNLIFKQLDTHVAFILDEDEHVLDSRLIDFGNEENLPPQIAVFSSSAGREAPGPHGP